MTEQQIPAGKRPKKPADLGLAGTRIWQKVASIYRLRPDEVRILEDAAREADLIDEMAAALVDAPRTVKGSQGQQVIHPLIPELRQHRMALAALLRQLKLPDADTEAGTAPADTRSTQARAAAATRWGKRV